MCGSFLPSSTPQALGVCLAAESDLAWRISPPARKALLDLLLSPGAQAEAGAVREAVMDSGPLVLEVSTGGVQCW